MKTFTQTPVDVCVRQDDLNGLNSLYPTCNTPVATPQCWKSAQYLGLVRLTMYVAVPAVVILLMVLCGHEALTSELKRRRDNLIHKNIEQVCYSSSNDRLILS